MFKKTMSWLLSIILILMLFVTGCGNTKVIRGVEYDTYGLFSLNKANENVEYKIIIGNVIFGIILFETIVAPVYFFGFSLYEPVGEKGSYVKGTVSK